MVSGIKMNLIDFSNLIFLKKFIKAIETRGPDN